jgi:hypothetical protein
MTILTHPWTPKKDWSRGITLDQKSNEGKKGGKDNQA